MTERAYTQMIADALGFFRELEAQNTKAFFDANRARFKADVQAPAQAFVQEMAVALEEMSGETVTGKLFRANRDVRFSKDKRPYNTHLHMSWALGQPGPTAPVWFFGVAEGYKTAGFGAFALKGSGLSQYREMVDAQGDALLAAVGASGAEIAEPGTDTLKRVPAPYDAQHRHADLLKRKGLTLQYDMAPALEAAEPFDAVRSAFARLAPVTKIIHAHLHG